MGASAQTETTTWDFKTPTEADKTNLDADKTDWEVYSSTRFRNKSVISEPTELTANGETLEFTKELQMTTNEVQGIRIIPGTSIQFVKGSTITIPNLLKGQVVTVKYKTNVKTASSVSPTNLTVINAFSESTSDVTASGSVSDNGDVTFTVGGTDRNYTNITSITVEKAVITIGDAGYATFCSENAYNIPEGLTAYVTDKCNSTKGIENGIKLLTTDILQANNGDKNTFYASYIIKGAKGTYYLRPADEEAVTNDKTNNAVKYTYNALRGNLTEKKLESTEELTYFLLGNANGIGFYPTSGENNLAAGKAYLRIKTSIIPAQSNAKGLSFIFEDSTTGIKNVETMSVNENAPMFNLAGQRVSKNYKGVVIQNGKKFINK